MVTSIEGVKVINSKITVDCWEDKDRVALIITINHRNYTSYFTMDVEIEEILNRIAEIYQRETE